jgi:hypothetical protein
MMRTSKREVTNRSPYTAPFEWAKGKLNDSSYQAFCKYAGKLLDAHPPTVLKEVAGLISAAGDTPSASKLVEQFTSAIEFIAHERACEALDVPELRNQRVEGTRSQGKWPAPDPALIEAIARKYAAHTLASWQNLSTSTSFSPRDVLPALFPPKSFVCFGSRKDIHYIRPLGDELYRRALTAHYVVPNPAKDYYIEFPDGRRSLKCDENFPTRRFLIIEFEAKFIDPAGKRSLSEILDLQSALHWHVAERTEALALLVFSGNKSLHAWHRCEGWDEARVIELLRYGCRLGADHSFSSPSQFTRMPAGRHANGTRQIVHFFKAL